MSYHPTPEHARTVEMWTRAGIGKERVAKRLGIPVSTLENTFPFELGFSNEEGLAIVADVAYQMAVSGQNAVMTKFWLETKGGWQAGFMGMAGKEQTPLQIILDPSVVVEGNFEEVEESNIVELDPPP